MTTVPFQITVGIPTGTALAPVDMATAMGALTATQLQNLAIAMVNAMATKLTSTQLQPFIQALLAAMPSQSVSGIPNTGQFFTSTSGFVEKAQ